MYNKLRLAVENKVKTLNTDDNSLIVLKGINLSLFDNTNIDLKEIIDNKFSYFANKIMSSNRQFISYEEFLLLKDFIVSQYNKIFILDNNIFINKYPVEPYFSTDICQGLINHFTESDGENDAEQIGNIDEIISIYSGFEASESFYIGAYFENEMVSDPKIHKVNLFDDNDFSLKKIDFDNNFVEIAVLKKHLKMVVALILEFQITPIILKS